MNSRATARRPRPGLRRRLDNLVLRWQARLDAEWADRVVPWAAAGLLFVLYFTLALARANSFEAGESLGAYTQAAWLISEGRDPTLTVTGQHLLAAHAPLVFYPLAMLTRVLPTIPTLIGLQAAALAIGIVPLWRLARRVAHLRVGAAIALAFAYGAYPAVNNLNLADFHPEALAVAPLIAATGAALTQRWRLFALLSVIVVACDAEFGLVVAGLGVLLVLEGRRRIGVRTAVFGMAYTIIGIFVIERRYGGSGLVAPGAFDEYGDSAFDVVATMITNPFDVLGDIFFEENVRVTVTLLAPLLFLPLLAPR